MIGWVLLFLALGISVVLVLVFLGAVRSRMSERDELMREGGADQEELEEARAHRPALKGWLVCSGAILVVATGLCGMWIKGCQTMGRSIEEASDRSACERAVKMQADVVGVYWDKNRKLPSLSEYPPGSVDCPLGNDFIYVGHKKVIFVSLRVVLVELQPHPDGSRRALVADQKFIAAGKPISKPTMVPAPGTGGKVVSGAPVVPVWAGWRPYARWFKTRTLSESDYESIRSAVEGYEEEGPAK